MIDSSQRPARSQKLLFLRERVSDRTGRSGQCFKKTRLCGSSAATTASSAPCARHHHEVLTSLGFIADRHAARRPVEDARPEHLARVFIVRADLAIVARVKYQSAFGDDDSVSRADASRVRRSAGGYRRRMIAVGDL